MVLDRIKKLLPLFLITILVDQCTKYTAFYFLKENQVRSLLYDTLRLKLVYNPNGFSGFLQNSPDQFRVFFLFSMVITLLTIGTYFLLVSTKLGKYDQYFLCLVLSGGFANLLDRLIHKEGVIDFIQITLPFFTTGIFNIADVFIIIGSTALGYLLFQKL